MSTGTKIGDTWGEQGFIENIGDINWVEHGGVLVFEGGGRPFALVVERDITSDEIRWSVAEVPLDKLMLSDESIVNVYGTEEWFGTKDNLSSAASLHGITVDKLTGQLISDDIVIRAMGYRNLWENFGMINFDGAPYSFSKSEMMEHFKGIPRIEDIKNVC